MMINPSHTVETLSHMDGHGDPLLQLAIPLVPVLELYPQLPNLHEGQDVRNPLNHEWCQFFLIW